MRSLCRPVDWLVRLLLYAATAASATMTAFVALEAFMRYIAGAPFAFSTELVGLLFSAMVFLSLPYSAHYGRNIRVTIIFDRLPPAMRVVGDVGARLLTLVFCFVYGRFAYEFADFSRQLGSTSDMGGFLLWPWMATMMVSCVLMGISTLLSLVGVRPADDPESGR